MITIYVQVQLQLRIALKIYEVTKYYFSILRNFSIDDWHTLIL